jgi:hypothetical protein
MRDNTPEDHDACLGTLFNIQNAGRGRGWIGDAYVCFNGGSIIHGDTAAI